MFVDYSLQFCFLAWIFAHFHLSGVTALHGPLTRACRFVAHSLLGCISHLYFTSFKDFFVILLTLARSDSFTEFNHGFLESMGSCEGEEGRTEDGLEVPPEHPPGKGQEGAWGMERGPRDRPRPRGPGRSARNHVWGQQRVFALLIPGEMSELSVRVRVGREEAPNGEIKI